MDSAFSADGGVKWPSSSASDAVAVLFQENIEERGSNENEDLQADGLDEHHSSAGASVDTQQAALEKFSSEASALPMSEPMDDSNRRLRHLSRVSRNFRSTSSSSGGSIQNTKSGLLVGRCLSLDWYEKPTASWLRRLLVSKPWELFSLVTLFLALFLADLFQLGQASDNTVLDAILLACFFVFSFEMFINALALEHYPMSFFFWMDLVGALSLMFDISVLFGMDASATENYSGARQTNDQAVLARASRAAKQASRAGRMSRILKLLRFLPLFFTTTSDDKKAARAISEKLTVNLATRVAFLAVCLIVVLPLFGMFVYPEVEDSISTHALLLSNDIQLYQEATTDRLRADLLARINLEVKRMSMFYSDLNTLYGPFKMCVKMSSTGAFNCDVDSQGLSFDPSFNEPRRRASILEVTARHVKILFNMASVRQYEALSNILFLLLTLILMIVTCFLLSSSVSMTVLRPLERVFGVVRVHCAEIVKVAARFHEAETAFPDEDLDLQEQDETSEIALLEKVFARISAVLPKDLFRDSLVETVDDAKLLASFTGQQFLAMTSRDSRTSLPVELIIRKADNLESDADYTVSAEHRSAIELHSFDLWQVPEELRETLVAYAIFSCKFCSSWTKQHVPKNVLDNFIETVKSNYKPTAFHNWDHGLDVAFEVRRYFYDLKHCLFDEEVYMWLLVAALGHDIGHPGVNNMFLVETAHEYALTYNDRSPLENLHSCLLFQVLAKEETNVFQALSKKNFTAMKSCMVNAILHTDMVKHNDSIKDLGILYTVNTEAFANGENQLAQLFQEEEPSKQTVLNALLHTADISNPMKPWDLCQLLADRCLEEFFAQGDQEKALGIPVQMLNDRDKVNRQTSQVGFIEFVIVPLAYQMATLFPGLTYLSTSVGNNMQSWADLWRTAGNPTEEEWQKVKSRTDKVRLRCEEIAAEAAEKLRSS
eukprot:TRINITY_DN16553_c0_g1_i1.p1 TRINITY_DN16553_c0_g1~~TRINITY_DN16553_c0_g1_i1.p1  ORF type:complete len:1039 (+),score=185.22 TRINITY_DN16553_c0_g1_i1:288-3119(+)